MKSVAQQQWWILCCAWVVLPHAVHGEDETHKIDVGRVVHSALLLCFFLVPSYVMLGFWLRGHALTPTRIAELGNHKSPGCDDRDEADEDCEPRATLSGRAVRYVFLHRSSGTGHDHHECNSYTATVELFHRKYAAALSSGEQLETVDIPLKSYHAYQTLQEYSLARDGKWWETTTKDASHPTNGYRLVVTTTTGDAADDDSTSRLFLYRPYRYDAHWKLNMCIYPFFAAISLVGFLDDLGLRMFGWNWILHAVLINVVAALLGNFTFVTFGYRGKKGPYWPWTKTNDDNNNNNNNEGSASASALRDPLFDPDTLLVLPIVLILQ